MSELFCRLGDIFDFKNGRSFKKEEWVTSGLPIIRIQNLNNLSANFNYFDGEYDKSIEVNSGDLLFSWSGTVGTSFGPHIWAGSTGLLNQHIYKLKSKKDINTRYAYYALLAITSEIEKSVVGAVGLVHVTKKSLNDFKIFLPPLLTQQEIVEKLDAIFAEIDKATLAAEANIKNAEALFQSYLTEVFGRGGQENKFVSLDEVCNITGGGTPSKSNQSFYIGDIPWATVRDMNNDYLVETDFKITKEAVKQSSTNIIPRDNVVIATRVGLGKVCIIKQDTAINQDLRGVVPKDESILDVTYLFYWFKSIANLIVNAGRGATVHGVTLPFIKSLQIPLPSLANQQKMVEKLNIISLERSKLSASYKIKTGEFLLLKESILKQAFNGELVKE